MNHPTELSIDENRTELQGFRDFYTREIEPQVVARKERQRIARRWLLFFGPAGGVATIVVGWVLLRSHGIGAVSSTGTATMALLTGILSLGRIVKLGWVTKDHLLGKVCRFFRFKYDEAAKSFELSGFAELGLVPPYDETDREDQIHGSHNHVAFHLAECRMYKRKWAALGWFIADRSRNEESGFRVKVYQGVLFRFRFPNHFCGSTWVLKDSKYFRDAIGSPGMNVHRVELDTAQLPTECGVWSSNLAEARQLLTPAFFKRVSELGRAFGSERLGICFHADTLLVSVPSRNNEFEVNGWYAGVNDMHYVERLVDQICTVFDIVDTLPLTLKT